MRYIKAETVLPPELIEAIQQYVDGQTLYIPRKTENRRSWGGRTDYRTELAKRNRSIAREHRQGQNVAQLAEHYYLSEKSIRRILKKEAQGMEYVLTRLTDRPELKEQAADWFHQKWGIPRQAYLDSMEEALSGGPVPQWYLATVGERIVGGLGVIENDFHARKDLAPNVCAVYTEPDMRGQGIAGGLLAFVSRDMKEHGVDTLYLVTGHTAFYERYGWEYLCPVMCDGEDQPSRMYIHK